MSDYIFSSRSDICAELTSSIKRIYYNYDIECQEYTGDWGSLSVSTSPYRGFHSFENDIYICVVLGGPALYFRNNDFLTGDDYTEGTYSILERFIQEKLDFVNDLSGPFHILVLNKNKKEITCITDMMSFIPSYFYKSSERELIFGSHVDGVARVAEKADSYDEVSLADFALHGVVTYPYTIYRDIVQMRPATEHVFGFKDGKIVYENLPDYYWLPYEKINFTSIEDAAEALREGIKRHVDTITKSMVKSAQFISGGEDSRVTLGLMPKHLQIDGYIFLDNNNREGRIAKKVANAHGANLEIGFRKPFHYIRIAEEANALIGTGHQYLHCHTLSFDKIFDLKEYPSVFGGYLSDSLLKGAYARKTRFINKIKILPERWLKGEKQSDPVKSDLFEQGVLTDLHNRRTQHVNRVRSIRPETVHEWFVLWPASMRKTIPNHYCNRRLFPSYEPFMSHEVIQISAAIPTVWKLNRKLFYKAFKPCFVNTKWIGHANGGLPYFGFLVNGTLQTIVKSIRKLRGEKENTEGPWPEFNDLVKSDKFHSLQRSIEREGREIFNQEFRLQKIDNPRNVLSLIFLAKKNKDIILSENTCSLSERFTRL